MAVAVDSDSVRNCKGGNSSKSLFLFCSWSYGQIGGKSIYQFLNLVTSPRQAALGGKVITIYDNDVNQAQFNPATINRKRHTRKFNAI